MISDSRFLWQYVDHWSSVKPDADAIVFEGRRITWSQLAEAVDRAAQAFVSLGVQRGDCVACISMARPEFLISFMAASKISAIWTGISPRYSISEMGRILRDCRPALLISQERQDKTNLLERAFTFSFELSSIREILVIGKNDSETPSFDDCIAGDHSETLPQYRERLAMATPDDNVLLMYTSGSSGMPKGVLHSHDSVLSNVRNQHTLFDIHGDSRILLHFPINHVAADIEIGYCALFAGACIVMLDGFDAARTLKAIDKERITVLGQVPAMYMLELRDPSFASTRWDSVETFVWGGSPAPREMLAALDAICRRTGASLITGYGSTEVGGFVTASKKKPPFDVADTAVGPAYDTCELRIVDENRNALPRGSVGEVAVRGPILMKGYLNDPAQTAEVFDGERWYYTNDLGFLDENNLLTLCGRRSEMFKTGGENVFPCEIETVLESHPDILFAAIIAVPDEVFSEVCHAHLMTVPGSKLTQEDVLAWCRKHLAHFKIPQRICFYATLPLLPNGKVDKMKLREIART